MFLDKLLVFVFLLHFAHSSQEKDLVEYLMRNYSKFIRPVHLYEDFTTVYVAPYIYDLLRVDEKQQSIEFIEWLSMLWNDNLLTWEPEEHSNITQIVLPYDQIWKPDIILFNVVSRQSIIQELDRLNVLIVYDGTVIYYQPEVRSIRCKLDVALFPWDTQNCTLQYGTWAYVTEYLKMRQMDAFKADPSAFILTNTNPEWKIVSLTGEEVIQPHETYTVLGTKYWEEVHFHLAFERKPVYHVFVMLIPSCIITTIAILGLFSPFNSEGYRQEKVTLGLTTLLTMAVMLQIVTGSVPRTSNGLPLLGAYIMAEFVISALGTAVSVGLMYIHERALVHGWKVPEWLVKLLAGRKGSFKRKIYEKNYCPKELSNLLDMDKEDSGFSTCMPRHTSLLRNNAEVELILEKLELYFEDLKWIKDYIKERESEGQNRKHWSMVMDKLDLAALIIFLVVNFALTIGILRPLHFLFM